MTGPARPIRICHIVHALDFGGMENGLVNLINRLPEGAYRHDIVCLTGAGKFAERLDPARGTTIHELHKQGGRDFGAYWRLFRLLRRLRPDIAHTRNLATCDLPWLARLAGARGVVHSEHGLDMLELSGQARRYIRIRRLSRPAVDHYIALGSELRDWLIREIGAAPDRATVIINGVDAAAFRPQSPEERAAARAALLGETPPEDALIVGTVGRLSPIKRQQDLIAAAGIVLERQPGLRGRLRVVIIGEGPERAMLEGEIAAHGLIEIVRLAGYRDDVAALLPAMGVFALPSHSEGISNTLLEAMAAGVAVVATDVGGNPELVESDVSALLVPRANPDALADALASVLTDEAKRSALGAAARTRAQEKFSFEAMVGA
jgi:sugar transferase (PEP-CTERM/EpsH1 system associated)